MSSLEITITDELSSRLAEAARQSGSSPDELVISLLEKTFLQETRVHKALKAMMKGEKSGEKLDIAAMLQNTTPHFITIDDAMRFSRKYR